MVQVYQFFNKPVPNLSIIVRMARKMLPCHFVSIILHGILKICHRKVCEIRQQENPSTVHTVLANSPAILAFLQKGGHGQKLFYFCDFFAEPIFA